MNGWREMSQYNRKMRLLMCSDDPETILSYGILSKMLIEDIYKEYDLHYLSLQRQIGRPLPIRNDKGDLLYTSYSAHNEGQRNPTNMPNVINEVKADILWTNFDIQHYQNIKKYIPQGMPWIGWIPWDNHDPDQIPRANEAFKNVSTRIAISKFGYDFLNFHGVEVDDYIYNIIDTKKFYPIKPDAEELKIFKKKNAYWYKDNIKVLLFVGRPNWRKRLLHMFAILKELINRGREDIRLFLHTSLDDPARTVNLRELIDSHGLRNYIITTPMAWDRGISKDDLRIFYNIADIYIAPHGGEGFGMPIGESMACGTPFIASDLTTTKEFAGDNFERGLPSEVQYPMLSNGQILKDLGVNRPYPIVNNFADKIEQLLADDKRRRRMGENGVKWVNENCSRDIITERWRKVFKSYDIPIGFTNGYL